MKNIFVILLSLTIFVSLCNAQFYGMYGPGMGYGMGYGGMGYGGMGYGGYGYRPWRHFGHYGYPGMGYGMGMFGK
uniref:Neuropeptide-like protein 31 n=1 Tax=Strongyloides papillosus TaxID=174720 RepID=A0A0N5C2X9_STREA